MNVVTGSGKTSLSMSAHSTGEAGVPARYPCRISMQCVDGAQGAGGVPSGVDEVEALGSKLNPDL